MRTLRGAKGQATPRRLVRIVTVPLSLRFASGQDERLSEAGIETHVVCSPGPMAEEYARQHRVAVHAIPFARRMAPFADMLALGRLLALLRRLRPHIVHAGTPKAGLLGTMAAWLLGVPVRVYCVHGLPVLTARGLRRYILLATEWAACAWSTHVLCVSHSMRRELIALGLCPAGKALVVGNGSSNGVDGDAFDPSRFTESTRAAAREEMGIPVDALVVGFIGRVVHDKGICELSAAWRIVRQQYASAYLLIVGPFEDEDPIPARTREALESDPRVRVIGADWNVARLYAAMDVFCLPSHREGCPNVVLEASAMQLPIAAFRIPGVTDVVDDGVTGRLAEPLDAESLAAVLGGYLADGALRARHGGAGRQRVIRLFDRDDVCEGWTQFLSALAFAPPRRRYRELYPRYVKRAFDVVAAALALAVAAPVLLGVAIAVRLCLGRPVLFAQLRPGRHGRPFRILKFRTMTDARTASGHLLRDADRLTRFGRWLRASSLDELPELWNVVRGDMSLVGPRPLLMAYLDRYTPGQARRHDVRPGITGLAQVHGRNVLTWDEKFAHDVDYVDRCSLLLDLMILVRTVRQVFARHGVAHPGHATMAEFVGSVAQ